MFSDKKREADQEYKSNRELLEEPLEREWAENTTLEEEKVRKAKVKSEKTFHMKIAKKEAEAKKAEVEAERITMMLAIEEEITSAMAISKDNSRLERAEEHKNLVNANE